MEMHTIEIDDKIWNHLKKFAEPFEDTPNSVLNRLLFEEPGESDNAPVQPISIQGVPKALSQIFEVLFEIFVNNHSRTEATKLVAKRRGTTPQTVIDKYCRQLNKRAFEIDQILKEPGLNEFKQILKEKFINHHAIIEAYFETLTAEEELNENDSEIVASILDESFL